MKNVTNYVFCQYCGAKNNSNNKLCTSCFSNKFVKTFDEFKSIVDKKINNLSNFTNLSELNSTLKQLIFIDNDKAQFFLGQCFYSGTYFEKNYKTAVYWLKKSASKGNPNAQYLLGECFYSGYGVRKNYEKAAELFSLAAEQNNINAILYLGMCYEFSKGVEQDYKKAVDLYFKAAEQGDSRAKISLSLCYQNGYGVPKDLEESKKWFLLSINKVTND
ncbi:MAG: sel1 repeat family protein [Clostridia bacterium]|nr:sel1 repeat family protein [Clostridia bacterium]